MALTRMNYFNLAGLLQLYRELGSATAIIENREHLKEMIPEVSPRLLSGLKDLGDAMKRAETEWEYDQRYGIQVITMNDSRYPQRLKECEDAPLVLFYVGTADLNQQRVINIVGTRHCTAYGQDVIRRFVQELKQRCPQVLIVSGTFDDNVHPQNTYELTERLVQADIPFDMHIYTNRNHFIRGGNTSNYIYTQLYRYLKKNL